MDVQKLLGLVAEAALPIPLAHIQSAVNGILQAVNDGKLALSTEDRADLDAIHAQALEAAQNLDRAAGQRTDEDEGKLPGRS